LNAFASAFLISIKDDDEGRLNNVAFNYMVKKHLTHEDNESDRNLDDHIDNENANYEKLVKEYELIYSK
jgi:hypothetical protein